MLYGRTLYGAAGWTLTPTPMLAMVGSTQAQASDTVAATGLLRPAWGRAFVVFTSSTPMVALADSVKHVAR